MNSTITCNSLPCTPFSGKAGRKREFFEIFDDEEDKICISAHPAILSNLQLTPKKTKLNSKVFEENFEIGKIDISDMKNNVEEAIKKLHSAFPYSKHGNGRDDYSFCRVRNTIYELKKVVNYNFMVMTRYNSLYSRVKLENWTGEEGWKIAFKYLQWLSDVCTQLPEFDTVENNKYKQAIYQNIYIHYMNAISLLELKDLVPKNFTVLEETGKALIKHEQTNSTIFSPILKSFKEKVEI